jgi:hypothetical protein
MPPAASPRTQLIEDRVPVLAGLLLVWILAWMGLQNALESPRAQLAALVLGLAALLWGAALAEDSRFRSLLTSPTFAGTQMAFLLLSVVAGTLIVQGEPPSFYLEAYSPLARRLISLGSAQDLYHSLWFHAQLGLLALSMALVAWKRRPYRPSRYGFLLVHVSTSLVLLGGIWGRLDSVKAFAELRTQGTTDTFYRVRGARVLQEPCRLPDFQLRLEKFEVVQHEPEFRLYAFTQPDGQGGFESNPKSFQVREGFTARLPLSDCRMEVGRLLPNAVDTGTWAEDPAAPLEPALRVLLGLGVPEMSTGLIFAFSEDAWRRDEPEGRFAVAYRDTLDAAQLARLRPRAPESESIVMGYMGRTLLHPVVVGRVWETPGYALTVKAVFPDFAIRKDASGRPEPYSRSQEPRDPWVQALFTVPGAEPKVVLLSARRPEVTDQLNAPNLPEGVFLRYSRRNEEIQSRFVVFTRGDRRVSLVERGRVVRSEPMELNKPFVIQPGLSVTATERLEHAAFRPDFQPDPAEASRFLRPVVQVAVWDPATGRRETHWLEAFGRDGRPSARTFLGGRVGLIYRQKDTEPRDFRSELVVLDRAGRELARKVVSVNDPLRYRGYWFYQSNYNPDDLTVSGIMVVREPGLWLTFLGFACLVAGLFWMFYLRPVLRAREGAP